MNSIVNSNNVPPVSHAHLANLGTAQKAKHQGENASPSEAHLANVGTTAQRARDLGKKSPSPADQHLAKLGEAAQRATTGSEHFAKKTDELAKNMLDQLMKKFNSGELDNDSSHSLLPETAPKLSQPSTRESKKKEEPSNAGDSSTNTPQLGGKAELTELIVGLSDLLGESSVKSLIAKASSWITEQKNEEATYMALSYNYNDAIHDQNLAHDAVSAAGGTLKGAYQQQKTAQEALDQANTTLNNTDSSDKKAYQAAQAAVTAAQQTLTQAQAQFKTAETDFSKTLSAFDSATTSVTTLRTSMQRIDNTPVDSLESNKNQQNVSASITALMVELMEIMGKASTKQVSGQIQASIQANKATMNQLAAQAREQIQQQEQAEQQAEEEHKCKIVKEVLRVVIHVVKAVVDVAADVASAGMAIPEEAALDVVEKGAKKAVKTAVKDTVKTGVKDGVEKGVKDGVEKGVKDGAKDGVKKGSKKRIQDRAVKVLKRKLVGIASMAIVGGVLYGSNKISEAISGKSLMQNVMDLVKDIVNLVSNAVTEMLEALGVPADTAEKIGRGIGLAIGVEELLCVMVGTAALSAEGAKGLSGGMEKMMGKATDKISGLISKTVRGISELGPEEIDGLGKSLSDIDGKDKPKTEKNIHIDTPTEPEQALKPDEKEEKAKKGHAKLGEKISHIIKKEGPSVESKKELNVEEKKKKEEADQTKAEESSSEESSSNVEKGPDTDSQKELNAEEKKKKEEADQTKAKESGSNVEENLSTESKEELKAEEKKKEKKKNKTWEKVKEFLHKHLTDPTTSHKAQILDAMVKIAGGETNAILSSLAASHTLKAQEAAILAQLLTTLTQSIQAQMSQIENGFNDSMKKIEEIAAEIPKAQQEATQVEQRILQNSA